MLTKPTHTTELLAEIDRLLKLSQARKDFEVDAQNT